MSETLRTITDPARELVELCSSLCEASSQSGETYLARKFGVDAWSREFFEILFTVAERCSLLKSIVETLDMDEDFRTELGVHVDDIQMAFSSYGLKNQWNQVGASKVGPMNTGPLKGVSQLVRQKISYPKLSEDELSEIASEVSTLRGWLEEHQLAERDFIRQALIEGLARFAFRLEKLQWLGWGYTLESLREVISAYMLLERGDVDAGANPDAAAMLRRVGSFVRSVYSRVSGVKDVAETGEWLLKAYGLGSLVFQGGSSVAGFLT